MSAPSEALDYEVLEYGVRVAGATLFMVDDGVDTGAIIAQVAVPVLEDDDVAGGAGTDQVAATRRALDRVRAEIAAGRE